jgi:hypothetical protein
MTVTKGQIANLGEGGRLSIPIDVLRAVDWWDSTSVDVMSELCRFGLFRVYLADEAGPLINALFSEISERPHDVQSETFSIAADRYRPLKLYEDGRLRLTKEICSLLGVLLGQPAILFVQPFPRFLEIMTLQFRADRLASTASSTSIIIPG